MKSPFVKLSVFLASMVPLAALAGTPINNVPEPGTWALIALAGAVGAVIARNKRK